MPARAVPQGAHAQSDPRPQGRAPRIGTRDCKAVVHTFASANVLTGKVTSRLYGSLTRTRRREGLSKTKRQVAFCNHLLDVSRAYPAETVTPKSFSSSTTRPGTAGGPWTGP